MHADVKQQKNIWAILAMLLLFAGLARFAVGLGYVNTFDTYWYRNWAVDLPNGLFTVYTRAEQITLDYPPVYLFFLWLTGLAYKAWGGVGLHEVTQMFLMKFWPIVFDTLCALLLYCICKKHSPAAGLFAAAAWALNPSMFFNSAMWGQTDSVMCFCLLLSFWLLQSGRVNLSFVSFAIACMTKHQCLFFVPVYLIALYYACPLKKALEALGWGLVTVVCVFLPFSMGAKDPLLIFDVYFGGAGKYPHCTLNAFNLYGILKLNWVEDSKILFGSVTYGHLSAVLTVLSVAGLVALFALGKRRCIWVGSLYFMQCLFMLMTRMHERYQIVVLPFALMAYITHRDRRFLHCFTGLSVITLINQAFLLLRNNNQGVAWNQNGLYDTWLVIFSVANLLLFAYTTYCCVRFFLTPPQDSQTTEVDVKNAESKL